VQLHPQVQHLAVAVLVPHRRLNLGPALLPQQLQSFLDGATKQILEPLEGEARGRPAEAAAVALRLLNRRCGPLSTAGAAGREALSSSGS